MSQQDLQKHISELQAKLKEKQQELQKKYNEEKQASDSMIQLLGAVGQVTAQFISKDQDQVSTDDEQDATEKIASIIEVPKQPLNDFLNIKNPKIKWTLIALYSIQTLLKKYPKAVTIIWNYIKEITPKIKEIFQALWKQIEEGVEWLKDKCVQAAKKIEEMSKELVLDVFLLLICIIIDCSFIFYFVLRKTCFFDCF